MTKVCLSCLLTFTVVAAAHSQSQEPLLPRQPTLSQTHVVFCYAGDLWIVGREGGQPKRLTSGGERDGTPVFSPDGSLVAFSRESGSATDVYVVPAAGGEPRRLAYNGGWAETVGWTRDGKQVVFVSSKLFTTLFSVSPDGGPVTELPPPSAVYGSFSPDGRRIAYLPFGSEFQGWKGYRGGSTSRIWVADLPDCRIEKIPRENSNDFNPMWVGDRIYFLSDRDGLISLFAYDVASRTVSKVIDNPESDILSASAGPGAIVYERFGSLHLYDFETRRPRPLDIRVSGEMPEKKPRSAKATDNLTGVRLSPTGDRVLFEAWGDLLVMPVGKGEARNLTNSPGAFERFPAWSPDGQRIAYFSDESGEYALHIRNVDGTGSVKRIDLGTPGFSFSPTWSPDAKKIAYRDHRLTLWYVDVDGGAPIRIDSDSFPERLWSRIEAPPPSWSPDSRWLSYTRMLKNHLRALCIYSLDSGQSRQVTDGISDVRSPQFDRSGRYLFFAASTNVGPTLGDDLSAWKGIPTRSIYMVPLGEADQLPPAARGDAPGAVTIDFEAIDGRIVPLSVPARNYVKLVAGKAGVLFLLETTQPRSSNPGLWRSSEPGTLYGFELAAKTTVKVAEGIRGLDLSSDGERLLYEQEQKWAVSPAALSPKPGRGELKLDRVEVRVEPAAEWRQMLREVGRAVRDFFYDPGYHGLDLKAWERRFEPYVNGVASPADLDYLFQEMLSELRVSHRGARAGAGPSAGAAGNGYLGADYEMADGRYRFKRIYAGDKWDPKMRAPLAQPGVDVRPGDFLLAVDGQEVRASDNIDPFLVGKSDTDVALRIAAGSESRQVTVVPTDDESSLRSFAWTDENRRKVDEASSGRVAYVYLTDTGAEGLAAFDRYFFAQADREAVIIDERDNGGGALADYFISRLSQQVVAQRTAREGLDGTHPYSVIRGPKVMIINEGSASGGDLLAYLFRRAGLGPLIGTRTCGYVMGPFVLNLIDGGRVAVPYFGVYTDEGKWLAENEGVAPDIEVEQDPAAVHAGHDPQLEKAIEVVMDLLKKNPPPAIKRPPYTRLQ